MQSQGPEQEEAGFNKGRWNLNLTAPRQPDQGSNRHEESLFDDYYGRHGTNTPHFCGSAPYSSIGSPSLPSRPLRIENQRPGDVGPFNCLFQAPFETSYVANSGQFHGDSLLGHYFKSHEGEESDIGTEADEVCGKPLQKRIDSINGTALAKKIAVGFFSTISQSSKTAVSDQASQNSQESINGVLYQEISEAPNLQQHQTQLSVLSKPSVVLASLKSPCWDPGVYADRKANSSQTIGSMDLAAGSQSKPYGSLNGFTPPSLQLPFTGSSEGPKPHQSFLKN